MLIPGVALLVGSVLFAGSVAAGPDAPPRPLPLGRRLATPNNRVAYTSNGQVATGPLAKARALLKYERALPKSLATLVANVKFMAAPVAEEAADGAPVRRRDGEVEGGPGFVSNNAQALDISWTLPVKMGTPKQQGTPKQELMLNLDTGSADLWVFSTHTNPSDVRGQSLYDPDKSSTASLMQGASWNISYADGSSANGIVYTDEVTVGSLTYTQQAVEVAISVSDSFTSQTNTDGLLGLSFGALNTVKPNKQHTFFENVIGTGGLTERCFAVDLQSKGTGSYYFGHCNVYQPFNDFGLSDVDASNGFWGFEPTVNGVKLSNAIADTGTTLLLIDDSACNGGVTEYWKTVKGATPNKDTGGDWTFPCGTKLPPFTFQVGPSSRFKSPQVNITIPGEYLNFAPFDIKGETCYGALQDSGYDMHVFGGTALKSAYVVFDYDRKLLWWAQKDNLD